MYRRNRRKIYKKKVYKKNSRAGEKINNAVPYEKAENNQVRIEIENYINAIKENEPRVYDPRYGRKFSQNDISACVIIVLFLYSPIFLVAVLSLLLNIYGLIFFIVIGIPTLIFAGITVSYYIKKHITEKFCINTDLGKCEVRIKSYKGKPALYVYFNKVFQHVTLNKNFFSYMLPQNQPKYTRVLVIKEDIIFLRNLLEYMKDNDEQVLSILSLIKNEELNTEYIDIEEKQMCKININTAKISQLSRLPILGKIDAIKVANHIQKNGEFESLWDFAQFINLEQSKTEILYKYVVVKRTNKNLSVIEQIKQDLPQFDNTLDIL